MGTRADFYVERNGTLEWLGSTAWDSYPEGLENLTILDSKIESEFRRRFAEEITPREDCTLPEHGWPWPWEDSHLTDYSYALRGDKVWTSHYGSPWYDHANVPEEALDGEGYLDTDKLPGDKPNFPNMKDVQNVTLGGRSGLMVLGPKRDR